MLKKTLSSTLLVLAVAGAGFAQVASTSTAIQVNTIYAGADGKYEATPDTAVIRMDVAAQQDTSRAAYDRAAAAVDHVRQVLKSNGVDVSSAQFGAYQLQPMYDWKNPKHKVVGYRVVSEVTLKLKQRDFTKVGPLTEQLADIEDTQNQSVNYTLEEIEQAKARASEDALKKARNQASAVATAGGRTLGELLYASVDVNQAAIVPMVMSMARSAAVPAATPPPMAEFTPQTVTINAHVNALFALK